MKNHAQTTLIILSLLFVFLLTVGCVSQSNTIGNTTTGTPSGTTTGTSAGDTTGTTTGGTGTNAGGTSTGGVTASGTTKEFTITAQAFSFDPATITVNKGDTVIIHATSTDVAHGIAIPAFGVNQQLPVGQEVTFQFVADQTGTFPFFCNVFCGEGHRSMKGSLIVK